MTKHAFVVGGLHCGGCVKSVQTILSGQAGVTAATVDLASGRAEVDATTDFDPKTAIQAVTQAGFSMQRSA